MAVKNPGFSIFWSTDVRHSNCSDSKKKA